MTRGKRIAIILLLLLIGLAVIVNQNPNLNASSLQVWIGSLGGWAPIVYILIYTLRPLIFFPASLLTLAGGIVFGAWYGTLFTVIGATLSALVGYVMADKIGKLWSKTTPLSKLAKVEQQMKQNGFLYVLWFRLVPFLNFDVVSYAAGIARVRILPFILATIIGMLPGTIAYNFLGDSLFEGDLRIIGAAVAVVIVFTLLSFWLRSYYTKREKVKGGSS